jgi:hypothetical protein
MLFGIRGPVFESPLFMYFRFGCDISYNDRSTRSAHEKKKHGASFRDVQASAAAAQIGTGVTGGNIPGLPHI